MYKLDLVEMEGVEKRGDIFQMKTRHATRATLYDSIINLLIVKMKKKKKKKKFVFLRDC